MQVKLQLKEAKLHNFADALREYKERIEDSGDLLPKSVNDWFETLKIMASCYEKSTKRDAIVVFEMTYSQIDDVKLHLNRALNLFDFSKEPQIINYAWNVRFFRNIFEKATRFKLKTGIHSNFKLSRV